MGKDMVKEHPLGLMDESMQGNTRMVSQMVKELTLLEKVILKETSMKENTRVVSQMVKEHTLVLMEKSIKENGRMRNLGTEHITTKTETSK